MYVRRYYFAEERFLSSTYFHSISFKYPAFFSCSTLCRLLTKYLQLSHVLEWSSLYREIFVPVFPSSTANNSTEARNRRKEVAPLSTITKGSFRSLAKIKSPPRRYYSAWRRIRETGCSPKNVNASHDSSELEKFPISRANASLRLFCDKDEAMGISLNYSHEFTKEYRTGISRNSSSTWTERKK